nr:LysR substrate-binding domain-containing protein [Burkholderia cenocepacia]
MSVRSTELHGSLKISAPLSFGITHVSPLIAEFLSAHPAVRLNLDLTDRRVDLIGEGFDLVLRIGSLEDSTLIARPLGAWRMIACASPAYLKRHLPQGAPTSPALANLCAFRFDLRLAALARSLDATYTRYADDLAFSGGGALARDIERLQIRIAAIALEEGFALQLRKTRVMRRGARQQLAGVVVNRHPNLARDAFDRLKAILTNCIRHGPASQNRDAHPDFRAHLAGRVAHAAALNAARGAKLRALFDRIAWEPGGADR